MKPLRIAIIMVCTGLMTASFPALSRDSDQTRDKLRIDQVESADRDRSADKERTMDRVQDRDKDPDQLRLKDKDCVANTDCDPQHDRSRDGKPAK